MVSMTPKDHMPWFNRGVGGGVLTTFHLEGCPLRFPANVQHVSGKRCTCSDQASGLHNTK